MMTFKVGGAAYFVNPVGMHSMPRMKVISWILKLAFPAMANALQSLAEFVTGMA